MGPQIEALEREVLAWRAARAKRLTAEDGWLALIGKFWLKPGPNRLGADPSSEVVFPKGRAPSFFATVHLENGVARLEAEPGAGLMSSGHPVTRLDLRSDSEPEPHTIELGSITFQLLRRGSELAIRVRDKESAARRDFHGVPCYPVQPAWRVVAELAPYVPERRIELAYETGDPEMYFSPGRALFEVDGKTYSLDPVVDQGRRRLFVLFADETNGVETYGSGRFLYAPLPSDGRVVLDFNQAFNPPCAFTPYAACPLPPGENRLALRVEAGEKLPYA
jgi:uncharacterized protein